MVSVAIEISHPPFGHENTFAALYVASASLSKGYEVTVVLRGDGVYTGRKGQVNPLAGLDPVRRVLSRMRNLVDGSLDTEGINKAIAGMAKATGKDPEVVDFVLELFASGDDRIPLNSICNVNFACYRCRVSDEQCAERRYEFGTAKEIVREETD